ncbi:MAG: hypothetical protein AB7H80_09370 [Candidatus Kapaibacterium sp.]
MKALYYSLFLLFVVASLSAQDSAISTGSSRDEALRLYIDCSACWETHIRSEITYVNYVHEPKDAQVHLLVTTRTTGSGGTEYTVAMVGRDPFEGTNDTLRFSTPESATEAERREIFLRYLEIGLMRYVVRTPLADRINVSYSQPASELSAVREEDPWNSWVFSVSLTGYTTGESSSSSATLSGSIKANHVTPEWKAALSTGFNYSESRFDLDDVTTIIGITRNYNGNGLLVKSLGDHWSAGGFFSASSGTYGNNRLTISTAPALEYNIYPYDESTQRQFRFLYRMNVISANYREETIYDKLNEVLFSESLSASYESLQTWGSANLLIYGSHYFHDINKYNIGVSAIVDFRLFKGVSCTMYGGVSSIRDQLALPKGQATPAQILLRQQQLATNFSYFTSLGLSYRFGSIFNNVVNPRIQ